MYIVMQSGIFRVLMLPKHLLLKDLKLSMSDEIVSKLNLSHCIALLNTICRIGNNGAKCANCEMQEDSIRNSYYVPLRPKSNEDHLCKQVALRINVCL